MKLTGKDKQLVRQFNQPDSHLVISHWPEKKGSFDGIATYTQDTVLKLAKYSGDKFIVLAEGKNFSIKRIGSNVLLIRAFDEKRVHLYPQILFWLQHFSVVKRVYVHSEFCASGGPSLRLLIIPFLSLIKLTGRKITFYAHNVVTDFANYASHFGKNKNGFLLKVWNWGYQLYFKLLALFVNQFVVLEQVLKRRLEKIVKKKKILVEPHWVDLVDVKNGQYQAKKALGFKRTDRLILSFGFLTHYKGADFLADFAQYLTDNKKLKNTKIILAGGPAHSLKDKIYYQDYYTQLKKAAKKLNNLEITGFLQDRDLALWLEAADLLVFPYRDLMGGSGALQQALQFEKPFLLSKKMAKNLVFSKNKFTFEHNFKDLEKKIKKYFTDEDYQRNLKGFVNNLNNNLSIEKLLPKHYQDIYQVRLNNQVFLDSASHKSCL